MLKNHINSFFSNDASAIGLILTLLGLWGCLAVYNTRIYEAEPYNFVARQLLWVFVGLIVYIISYKIPFQYYKKYVIVLSLLFFVPLMIVSSLGNSVNGMSGWFVFQIQNFPIFIQPSELAKPAYILCISFVCFRFKIGFTKFTVLLIVSIIWIIPIIMEPDFGTALVYFAGFIIVYWIGEGKKRYLAVIFAIAIISAIVIVMKEPYVLKRIYGFLFPLEDPTGSGWHILQFRHAIARGGLQGVGFGKAVWSNSYLPLSHSDSIFSSLAETLGFIGTLPIIIGFLLLIYLTFTLAFKSKDYFIFLFSCSLVSVITFQAFLHISVNVGLLPPTGITLPLISYGGSSLVSTMLGFGILLSAAKYTAHNKSKLS